MQQMDGRTLGIIWSDGHLSRYSVRNLRLECHCAHCVDEWTRAKLLKDETVPQDIKPVKIETVGRYAFKFDWSDGHSTGIYPFDALRKLCECQACRKA
jgi:ATP-binding protein involved in chromosome partitioning